MNFGTTVFSQILAFIDYEDFRRSSAGFGISRSGGDSWEFITDGMHAHYSRAVAIAGDTVLVSASTGRTPVTRRSMGSRSTAQRSSSAARMA